jgi:hypothetical protein
VEVGVGVGVGVNVGVGVGVEGTMVAVGGTSVGVHVGVAVGVERRSGDTPPRPTVGVPWGDIPAAPGTGSELQMSRAATTPATKLRAGSTIQPFPIVRLSMCSCSINL